MLTIHRSYVLGLLLAVMPGCGLDYDDSRSSGANEDSSSYGLVELNDESFTDSLATSFSSTSAPDQLGTLLTYCTGSLSPTTISPPILVNPPPVFPPVLTNPAVVYVDPAVPGTTTPSAPSGSNGTATTSTSGSQTSVALGLVAPPTSGPKKSFTASFPASLKPSAPWNRAPTTEVFKGTNAADRTAFESQARKSSKPEFDAVISARKMNEGIKDVNCYQVETPVIDQNGNPSAEPDVIVRYNYTFKTADGVAKTGFLDTRVSVLKTLHHTTAKELIYNADAQVLALHANFQKTTITKMTMVGGVVDGETVVKYKVEYKAKTLSNQDLMGSDEITVDLKQVSVAAPYLGVDTNGYSVAPAKIEVSQVTGKVDVTPN